MPVAAQSLAPVGVMTPCSALPVSPTSGGRFTPNSCGANCQKFVFVTEVVLLLMAYLTVTPPVTTRGSAPRRITCACRELNGGRMHNCEKSWFMQCMPSSL
jgi:hypothetical protein